MYLYELMYKQFMDINIYANKFFTFKWFLFIFQHGTKYKV